MTAFRGASMNSLDDKSRLIVPKRFQESVSTESDQGFVLTASPDGCLLLMEQPAFERITERLGDDPLDPDRRNRSLRRIFLGHAEDVRPDKAGRIVIPEPLRQYMGLGAMSRDVVVVGTGSTIEVWSTDRWNKTLAADARSSLQPDEAVTD